MLSSYYLPQVRSLLQLPGSNSTSLYSDADLTRFINIARGQVAGEGQCIRVLGTISTIVNQQPYNFVSVNTGVPAFNGIQGIINIRSIRYNSGGGSIWIPPRPWPWFELYELNNGAPVAAPPKTWSVFAQGTAPVNAGAQQVVGGGSFYVSPPPDDVYVLNCNSVCYPIPLIDDTTAEALPYLWTDAVPFFAAYFALMSAQTNARMADAATMYKGHYNEFMDRARKQANSDTGRWQYDQAQDPVQALKLGIKGGAV